MKVVVALVVIFGVILNPCLGGASDRPITERSISTEELIIAFYKEYIASDDGDSICKKYMSEVVVQKIKRVRAATNIDVITRAQDDNEDMVESLSVESLSNDWYMVSYLWNIDDSSTLKQIPLKAVNVNGALQINYITPDWYGSNHSDEQLVCGRCVECSAVNHESGLLFLESFYNQYLYAYCHMNIDSQIILLRNKYLSDSAMADFVKADSISILDGCPGYDLLIDNFDFDPLCHKSIEFTPLGESRYRVDYSVGSHPKRVELILKRDSCGYQIDSINI